MLFFFGFATNRSGQRGSVCGKQRRMGLQISHGHVWPIFSFNEIRCQSAASSSHGLWLFGWALFRIRKRKRDAFGDEDVPLLYCYD